MSADTKNWRVLNGPPALNRAQRRQAKRGRRDVQPTLLRPDLHPTPPGVQHAAHSALSTAHSALSTAQRDKREARPKLPKLDPEQYSMWLVALSQVTGSAAAADALVQDARRHGIEGPARQLSYTTALTFERASSLLQQALDCFPNVSSVN